MWCPDCAAKHGLTSFWPISDEYWDVQRGLARCRACWAEKKRREEKGRRATKREELIAANKAYYQENRELLRWKQNQYKAARRAATQASAPASNG